MVPITSEAVPLSFQKQNREEGGGVGGEGETE